MKAWTREAALDALRREAQRIGRTPGAKHLWDRGRVCPTCKVYQRLFGSLKAAQVAAGLPLNDLGGRKGWRKKVCHRGHRRTPDNLSRWGHCLTCARDWRSPRRATPGFVGHITPKPIDPDKARELTERKKAYWCSVEHGETARGNPKTTWVHPYARRSA